MRRLYALALAALLAGCAAPQQGIRRDLALVSADSTLVVGVSLDRLRASSLWRRFVDFAKSTNKSKAAYDAFAAHCVDFDALDGPREILFWLNPADKESGAFVVRLGRPIAESSLGACLEPMKANDADTVGTIEHEGKRIWRTASTSNPDKGGVVLLDDHTIGIGTHGSVRQLIDRYGSKQPVASASLVSLVERVERQRGAWFAGEVSPERRQELGKIASLPSLGAVTAMIGAIDLDHGLGLDLSLDAASASDAIMLETQLGALLTQGKASNQIILLGMKGMLDGITVRTEGHTVRVSARLTEPQIDDLLEKLKAILRMAKDVPPTPPAPPAPAPPPKS